jgi:hypothetical protein
MTFPIKIALCGSLLMATLAAAPRVASAQNPFAEPSASERERSSGSDDDFISSSLRSQIPALKHAAIRLPIAAILSAALAFRFRRRGTPKRQAPVIQTQIILAIVGAVVMLVVGSSLARAFGIVGAAGLIRYRAKVDDPKDAGVMLSTLAIGLSSGVGLYLLAAFGTAFILGVLLILESFDPEPRQRFDLTLSAKDVAESKDRLEAILRRRQVKFEIRSTSPDELCYEVKMPMESKVETISDALTEVKPDNAITVKWEPKKEK